jgi:integrase/recombinase XerD
MPDDESEFVNTTTRARIIEGLFFHRDAVDRHLNAPMLLERESLLWQLIEQGKSRKFVIAFASTLCHIVEHVEPTGKTLVGENDIQEGATRWGLAQAFALPKHGLERERNFRAVARIWFQFNGTYSPRSAPTYRFQTQFDEFVAAMRNELGYRQSSITSCASPTRRFLLWASERHENLSEIDLSGIDDYVAGRRASGCSQQTLIVCCQSLRTFFRYAERRGWRDDRLSKAIRAPISAGRQVAPKNPPWKEVRLTIAALEDSNPSHCRARAVLLLASIYGLRRCEIVQLTLDDIDWSSEVLTVRRAKSGRVQQFPIQFEVGEAIIQYLRDVRPKSRFRNVFLTLYPPHKPAVSIAQAVYAILRKSGGTNPPWGLHAFRHACATELLRQATSLRSIADLLGHRDLRSVGIYAKCDTHALARVADFSLDGVL